MIVIMKSLNIQSLLVVTGVLSIILFTSARPAHSDSPVVIFKASACITGTTTDPKRHDALDLATARKRCDSEAGEAGFKHGFLRPWIPEIDKVLPKECGKGIEQFHPKGIDQFYCFGVGKRTDDTGRAEK